MSDERKKIEVGLGEKCEASADVESLELLETFKPEEDEVGGRYERYAYVQCPYCRNTSRIIEETNYRKRFSCCYCGYIFVY